jgi:hypothetical protein
MARFAFCGPTYQSESVNVDAQRAINLYPEFVESQQGRTAVAMYQRPGLQTFVTLAGESSVPQLFQQNGRMFAAGLFLWEVFTNGTVVKRGNLNPALGAYVTIVANQNQLLILSNGNLYVMDLTTNVVTPVNMAQFNGPIQQIAFCDSFFTATQQNSQNFYTSNLLDGTTWAAVNAEQISLITDNIVSHIVSHRDVWFLCTKNSIVYTNSGALLSPFIPISGAFVEQGSAAIVGVRRLNNSIFWLGQDERGSLVAYTANAYTPQRVSNHAVESAWQKYAVASDAVTYDCQFNGHLWWVILFPTANATWVYDVATNMWHEWTYFNPALGPQAHRSQCHCFAFNRHFVGDTQTGTIYQMSLPTQVGGGAWSFATDFGTPIQRLRRAPAISKELEWIQHYQMEVDLEPGLGPIPSLAGTTPATYITLADPSGDLWAVGVTDLGIVSTTPIASQISPQPTAQTVVLTDNQGEGTYWLLGITTLGVLTFTKVTVAALPGYGVPPNVKYQVSLVGASNAVLVNSGQINSALAPLSMNTTGATLLIAVLSSINGGAIISDSLSNNWQTLLAYTDPTTKITTQICYVYNPITSQPNPAVDVFTLVNQNQSCAVVYAFAGTMQAAGVLDVTNGVAHLLPSPFQPGSISPIAGDLVLTGFACATPLGAEPTVNDAFGTALIAGQPGTAGVAAAFLLNAPATALNPTWTSPESGVPAIAAFRCPSSVVATITGAPSNVYQLISASGTLLWNLEVSALGVMETVSNGNVTREPQIYLRWSDDGGHTYSFPRPLPFGNGGEYQTRVIWRRLGRSRNRVYEVSCTDPVPLRIVDAYLKASGDFQPSERLVSQYRKQG